MICLERICRPTNRLPFISGWSFYAYFHTYLHYQIPRHTFRDGWNYPPIRWTSGIGPSMHPRHDKLVVLVLYPNLTGFHISEMIIGMVEGTHHDYLWRPNLTTELVRSQPPLPGVHGRQDQLRRSQQYLGRSHTGSGYKGWATPSAAVVVLYGFGCGQITPAYFGWYL